MGMGFFKNIRKSGVKPGSAFSKLRKKVKVKKDKKLTKWAETIEQDARERGKMKWSD